MKVLSMISFLLLSFCASAQTPGEQMATKIAQKMKDSLSLTTTQQTQIYDINMQLHQQKQLVFGKYTVPDSIRIHLQRIENTRDTLYSTVLTSEKYLQYKQKKLELVYNH